MENKSLQSLIHKTVSYNYKGQSLKLALSQQLFSSYDIDTGSHLLLKSLAKRVELKPGDKVIDIGCGVGTLGLALKSAQPGIILEMQDRDALAVAFSRYNAEENQLNEISFSNSLMLCDTNNKSYDLIVSNIPAKVGKTVIQNFISGIGEKLSQNGIAAIVIVYTLADWFQSEIEDSGEILYVEKSKNYSVFHFRTLKNDFDPTLKPYIRQRSRFVIADRKYKLDTVFNLPNFDLLSHDYQFYIKKLEKESAKEILCIDPGQGHFPKNLGLLNKEISIKLFSRDVLSIKITEQNCAASEIKTEHLQFETLESMVDSYAAVFDTIYVASITLKEQTHIQNWLHSLLNLLSDDGRIILGAKSNQASTIKKILAPRQIIKEQRHKAYRILQIRK